MKLRSWYKMLIAAAAVAGITSCEKNFLDTKVDTLQTQETLNTNFATLVSLANAPYSFLRNEFTMLDNNLFAAVTNDAVQTNVNSIVRVFNNGSWDANFNPDNYYSGYYAGIRAANNFLEQSGNYKAFLALNRDTSSVTGKLNYSNDTLNMRWYRAEAHILRAWYYFELSKRYGGVPLVTRTLDINENTALPKVSYDSIVSFIVNEVDGYKDSMQVNWKTSAFSGNDGRLTRGMALALKGRALLYAASPLHNTNNDVTKWQRAAAALNDVIVLGQGAGAYSLDGNYRNYFLQNNTITSAETIWAIRYGTSNLLEALNYPITTAGGNSGLTPTQNLVDEYEYTTATPDPANPYANRDPRLGLTIVTNNSTWNGRTILLDSGAADDMRKPNATRTGYYLKKFLNENLNLTAGQTVPRNWAMFRYAEVLLEYAEAMNEAYGPDNANNYSLSARAAINRVRARSGVAMPAVTATSQTAMRAAVKHERRVELAFENYRYWDLLRWKDAEVQQSQPATGVMVRKSGGVFSYTPVTVENRVFVAPKMYFYPFPQLEIAKSRGALQQNLGW